MAAGHINGGPQLSFSFVFSFFFDSRDRRLTSIARRSNACDCVRALVCVWEAKQEAAKENPIPGKIINERKLNGKASRCVPSSRRVILVASLLFFGTSCRFERLSAFVSVCECQAVSLCVCASATTPTRSGNGSNGLPAPPQRRRRRRQCDRQ